MSKIKVNSIEAATGSTITIPSGQTLDISATTLTLPSTVVTTTGTQTLTNKTIGVSQLSGTIPTTIGGTGLTTIGTAAQVLRVNSGATGLEYATAAVGSRTLLTSGESNNVTSLAISSTYLTSSYNVFEIFISHAPRGTTAALELFVSTNNGTNYHNVDRIYHFFQVDGGGGANHGVSSEAINTDRAKLAVSLVNGDFANSYIQIIRPKFSGGTGTHRNRNTIIASTVSCQNVGTSINIEEVKLVTCISTSDATNRNSNINNIKFEGNGASMDYKYAVYGITY